MLSNDMGFWALVHSHGLIFHVIRIDYFGISDFISYHNIYLHVICIVHTDNETLDLNTPEPSTFESSCHVLSIMNVYNIMCLCGKKTYNTIQSLLTTSLEAKDTGISK